MARRRVTPPLSSGCLAGVTRQLLLELGVEPGKPRAARSGDEGGVEEPVTLQHASGVTAGERVLDLINQVRKLLVDGGVAVCGERICASGLDRGACGVNVGDVAAGDLGDHDAAVHVMAD